MGIVKNILKQSNVTESELKNVIKMWTEVENFKKKFGSFFTSGRFEIDFENVGDFVDVPVHPLIENIKYNDNLVRVVFKQSDDEKGYEIHEVIFNDNSTYVGQQIKRFITITPDDFLNQKIYLSWIKRVYCHDEDESEKMFKEFIFSIYPNFKDLYERRDDEELMDLYSEYTNLINRNNVKKIDFFVDFVFILYDNLDM